MGTPDKTSASTNSVDYEKRFKDTQGAFTRSQQELKATKAKLEALEKIATPRVDIPKEVADELEELKYSNPNEWRTRVNALEEEAKVKQNEQIQAAAQEVIVQETLASRQKQLEEFNKSHPDLQLTDDVIKYDVPPRITAQLEKGEITFEQFLEQASNFLSAPKVIGDGNTTSTQPNLNKVGGDSTPTKTAVEKDLVQTYGNIVY